MGTNVSVSPELRERVAKAARELGYRPNSTAQSLRRGQSKTVALLVGDIEQSHFSALTKHVQSELVSRGRDLMLHNLAHREDLLSHFLEEAPRMQLGGIILASSDVIGARVGSLLRSLLAAGLGIVAAGQDLTRFDLPSVIHNERVATRHSVEHLIRNGARQIAYIGRIGGSAIGTERLAGYRDALAAAGLPIDNALIWDESVRYSAGLRAVSRAIANRVSFDAIQAGSDELAMGAMAALHDHGRRVPEDVQVIGFGNVEMSGYMRPALTTLSSHSPEMARNVCDLLDHAARQAGEPSLVVIERGLVRRGSA
jgi:DNA-binding LacI/PurR family transcriptional regulator